MFVLVLYAFLGYYTVANSAVKKKKSIILYVSFNLITTKKDVKCTQSKRNYFYVLICINQLQ